MSTLTSLQPCQRMIVAVDIEGSTARNNSVKAHLRKDMYDLFEQALLDSGITKDLRDDHIDRGDGVLALIHPVDRVPKTRLLNRFAPMLSDLLDERNASPRARLRLRAAIHSGDVARDEFGWLGEDIDVTVRMLDDPALKTRLRQTSAPLVLVVSDHIHRSIVRHGYEGIDESSFEQLIKLEVAGLRYCGWVQVPGEARPIDKVS